MNEMLTAHINRSERQVLKIYLELRLANDLQQKVAALEATLAGKKRQQAIGETKHNLEQSGRLQQGTASPSSGPAEDEHHSECVFMQVKDLLPLEECINFGKRSWEDDETRFQRGTIDPFTGNETTGSSTPENPPYRFDLDETSERGHFTFQVLKHAGLYNITLQMRPLAPDSQAMISQSTLVLKDEFALLGCKDGLARFQKDLETCLAKVDAEQQTKGEQEKEMNELIGRHGGSINNRYFRLSGPGWECLSHASLPNNNFEYRQYTKSVHLLSNFQHWSSCSSLMMTM